MKEFYKNKTVCNWCGQITEIIWVHGHGQCRFCGTNIEECCKGEICFNNTENSLTMESVSKNSSNKK